MNNIISIKQKLYVKCMEYVDEKISALTYAIEEARESAIQESKSSMGDKYETGVALMHLEIEKYSTQLSESMKLKEILSGINIKKLCVLVEPGSIVYTNLGIYFIAINTGEIILENEKFLTISLASPIGKALYKMKAGDKCIFRDKTIEIHKIQ